MRWLSIGNGCLSGVRDLIAKCGARVAVLFSEPRMALTVGVVAFFFGLAMEFAWLPDNFRGAPSGWHAASVMMGCGQGFRSPEQHNGYPLEAFLNHERRTISFEEAMRDANPSPNMGGFELTHYYLFHVIGAVWWLFGLSWGSIGILQAVVLGITGAILYGIFRLGMNRVFSAMGALLFLSTPLFLSHLLIERDFSKAPFILGSILILGCLARKEVSTRRYFLLAIGAGLVAGIGLGFRQDMTLCVAPAIAILLFCPLQSHSRWLAKRVVAIGAMLAVWYVSAFPILATMRVDQAQSFHSLSASFGCNVPHATVPGSMRPLLTCGDEELALTYSSFASRTAGTVPMKEFCNPYAEQAARRFIIETAMTYPADCISRAYACALYILSAKWSDWYVPIVLSVPMRDLGNMQKALASHWQHYLWVYLLVAFLLLAVYSVRTAWLALFILLYFCCTTSLQFMVRHVFHLCFIPVWIMAFTIDNTCRRLGQGVAHLARKGWREIPSPKAAIGRMALFVVVSVAVILVPLYAARAYQHWKVGTLIPKYTNAELEPITYDIQPGLQPDRVRLHVTNWPAPDFEAMRRTYPLPNPYYGSPFQRAEYLVIECEVGCENPSIIPVFSPLKYQIFTIPYEIRVCEAKQPVRVKFFAPIYELSTGVNKPDETLFTGLDVAQKDVACIKGLYRVKNLNDFRLLPYVTLPEDPSYCHRYDTFCNIITFPRGA